MKRILLAIGTLAAVVVLGVGAVSVVGSTGDPAPRPTKDASRPVDRDALDEQATEQARQTQAAQDDLARRVGDEAQRLRDAQ